MSGERSAENDALLDPGQAYYIEWGWSGCAGSAWPMLPQATKDGWTHAERWERKFREAQAEIAQVRQVCRELSDTRVTPPEVLRCNAAGIRHGPHAWDFGSGVDYQCPGCCDDRECTCVTPPETPDAIPPGFVDGDVVLSEINDCLSDSDQP